MSLGEQWLRTKSFNILQTAEVTHKSTYKLRFKKIHSALHPGTHAAGGEGHLKSDFKVLPLTHKNNKADVSTVPSSVFKHSTTQKYIIAYSAPSLPDSMKKC